MGDSGLKNAPWRQDLGPLPWQSRWVFRLLKPLSHLLYRPRYVGLEHLPRSGPYIILANHQSFFDVMLINSMMPVNPIWLGKQELFKNPLLAPVLRGFGTIPINREASNFAAVKQVLAALKNNQVIGIFPEGTRIRDGRQGEIIPKPGLVRLLTRVEVPLIPIALEYPLRLFHKHRVVIGPAFSLSGVRRGQEDAAGHFMLEQIYQLLGPWPSSLLTKSPEVGESSHHGRA